MDIYDRWGRLLFHTQDFYQGWDGTDGSGYVQEGVYVYHIKYFTGVGKEFETRGYLSVIVGAEE